MFVWLVWICCLTGLSIAESSGNSTCGVTCESVLKAFQNYSAGNEKCVTKYFKLNLTLQKGNNYNGSECAANTSKYTCTTVREKQYNLFKNELSQLEELKFVEAEKHEIVRFEVTEHQTSYLFKNYEVGIESPEDVQTNKSCLMSALRFKNRDVEMMRENSEELAQYDRVDISPNSTIVVLSMFNENGTESPETVRIRIPMHENPLSFLPEGARILKLKRKCVYLNVTENKWDDSACVIKSLTAKETVCVCEHNSAFAVVFATHFFKINDQLRMASTGLEIASIVTLLISIVLLIVYRTRMRNFDRVLVQINLCIALMLTHLFFVIGPLVANIDGFCKAVALLSHYFLVVSAIHMVMEGALMLTKILVPNVFNNSTKAKKRRVIGFAVGWGVPLIYVTICTAVGFSKDSIGYNGTEDNYIRFWGEREYYNFCWINPNYSAVVIAPVAVAIAINTAIAIRLGALVWKMSKSAEEFKPSHLRDVKKASHAGKALRAVTILLPIFGIPWLIGFLVNLPMPFAVIFASMHVVVNGLQGVLLFLHFVVFNSEMRAIIKRTWNSTVSSIVTVTPTVYFVSSSVQNVE